MKRNQSVADAFGRRPGALGGPLHRAAGRAQGTAISSYANQDGDKWAKSGKASDIRLQEIIEELKR